VATNAACAFIANFASEACNAGVFADFGGTNGCAGSGSGGMSGGTPKIRAKAFAASALHVEPVRVAMCVYNHITKNCAVAPPASQTSTYRQTEPEPEPEPVLKTETETETEIETEIKTEKETETETDTCSIPQTTWSQHNCHSWHVLGGGGSFGGCWFHVVMQSEMSVSKVMTSCFALGALFWRS